jgi:hypothetical protein
LNKYAQSGIVLEVNTAPTLDVGMKVGSVSEQGTVEAAAIQVETRTQSVGHVVDTARVLEMPLNGREVHELIFLAGMANYPGDRVIEHGGELPDCGRFRDARARRIRCPTRWMV